MYQESEKFAEEVDNHKDMPSVPKVFPTSNVEQSIVHGMFVTKPCIGMTANQVKKISGVTAKKMKLESIFVQDPFAATDSEKS